ncbi:MAG: superoxide dismutase [Holosporaceae bacterium]|nr:superoxide dismutase [Holosporaceae bacterium]
MKFYAQNAHQNNDLAPILSQETQDYHYGKHHCGYANALNSLAVGREFVDKTLEEIVVQSRGVDQKIFNNAAQLFNHDFYWKCLKISSERPRGKLKTMAEAQFGSWEAFLDQYAACANAIFGSGWCWLTLKGDQLAFCNSSNAENPLGSEQTAICVVDLWEHAYYIDYRNDRASYIGRIIRECLNWEFCESQLPIDF